MYYGEAVSVTTPMLHRVNPRLRQMYIRLPWRARLVDESLAEDASRQDTDVGRAEQDAVRMRVLVQALEQRLPAINDVRSPAVAEAGVIVELASGGGRAAGRKLHVPGRTLVFVSSVDSADRVVQGLLAVDPTLKVAALHKRVDLSAREEVLRNLDSGDVEVLVCTNLGARGLDYEVDHVIQYEFATDAVAHLHRIGRTARAGAGGTATCIIDESNAALVDTILAAEDGALDGSFSRRRSFARRRKKAAREAAELEQLEQEVAALDAADAAAAAASDGAAAVDSNAADGGAVTPER